MPKLDRFKFGGRLAKRFSFPAGGGAPVNNYVANAVNFNSQYFSVTGPTYGANQTTLLVSFWFNSTTTTANSMSFMSTSGPTYELYYDLTNHVFAATIVNTVNQPFFGSNTPITTTLTLNDGNWHHFAMSMDVINKAIKVYIDRVDRTAASIPWYANGTLSNTNLFNTANQTIGLGPGAVSAKYNLADYYLNTGTAYLDLTQSANLAKFIDSNNKPVDLGSTGQNPTGSTPDVFFTGPTATWPVNKGTCGTWGAITLTTAATHP